MLKDGICLADLQRETKKMNYPAYWGRHASMTAKRRMMNGTRYLMDAIDEYLDERETCA